tara:strand:- start:231 stop:977 length:747 start_codon:yes stop_codon:yes gene_type:complete
MIKDKESLERKLRKQMAESNTVMEEIDIWDLLRFTVVIQTENPEDFKVHMFNINQALNQLGITPTEWIKNTFCVNNFYKGINVVYQYDGISFEMQFHTPKSYQLKEDIHDSYERFRLEGVSESEKCELARYMHQMSTEIPDLRPCKLTSREFEGCETLPCYPAKWLDNGDICSKEILHSKLGGSRGKIGKRRNRKKLLRARSRRVRRSSRSRSRPRRLSRNLRRNKSRKVRTSRRRTTRRRKTRSKYR